MRITKVILTITLVAVLQSCYTMLNPPQTQPETVTTVVSRPAMVSTIGGGGIYGWDPYWEPALPFTSYHTGYGYSYYSPYNYYDYHHPHYAPVYIVGESSDPDRTRDFDRDEKQGGSRVRERNNTPTSGSSGSGDTSVGLGSGMSTGTSPIITQPVKPAIIAPPVRTNRSEVKQVVAPKKNVQPPKTTKPAKVTKSVKVRQTKESTKTDSPPPKKRTRTRK